MALGYMEELPRWEDKQELCRLLNDMVLRGQHPMCDNALIVRLAHHYYQKLVDSGKITSILATEKDFARRRHEEITIKLSTLTNVDPREVGAEHVAVSCLNRLQLDRFLTSKNWSAEDIKLAKVQIAARSIYPFSEYKTARVLQDNSGLCELVGIDAHKITKDKLYTCAKRLYELHHELENWLSNRVRTLFGVENKVLLFDLTNTYFEGRMQNSSLAKHGRSKEKRSDCKQVVLAAVVNTQGLLVRTQIFEGNTGDCTTLQSIIQSLESSALPQSKKKVIVMDAGISTKENLSYLKEHGYNYITVARSSQIPYEELSDEYKTVYDNKGQSIKLKLVKSHKTEDTLLLVESKGKALKEESMYERSCALFEEGLKAICAGITKKGGTKKRDKVNERIGRIKQRCTGVWADYEIRVSCDKKDIVTAVEWCKKPQKQEIAANKHGKYLLQTNLDETNEENIWEFYNVIRTVEETFRVLKTDLDIRPVFHKTDDGSKAHLHLAVLAYWIVSCSRYQLKKAGIKNEWSELVRILSTHKVVSTRMEQSDGQWIEIRQCTSPTDEVEKIYQTLKLNKEPYRRQKFVWHPRGVPEEEIKATGGKERE